MPLSSSLYVSQRYMSLNVSDSTTRGVTKIYKKLSYENVENKKEGGTNLIKINTWLG